MLVPFVRRFTYREIEPGKWGAFVGFQLVATAGTEDAVRALVSERHR
ncbi:hypothetical protein GA0061101_106100 [Rhizobium lusitanum]|uniref:Uncharacterized protein n=1 Tax=Rhizobium lusitanum TaxID=293958 RepID=A0A1C3VRP1_9HYPH|nr:hypothetical protein GA0061101_106100 [Rhizobium lusitanum]